MNHPLDYWRSGVLGSLRDQFLEEWPASRLGKQSSHAPAFDPRCEVTEAKTQYQVRFDLPGLSKEQIKIDLHEGVLTVSGERKEERKEEDKKRHISEVFYGSFLRSFSFPVPVDSERVEARYEAGVLNITIPKAEGSQARQITVK